MKTITHGIPQGSTLSTTFFLLYINDIINTVQSKVYTYADDTTLVITAANKTELQELAQKDINSIIHYFHANNLVPNAKKTNYTTLPSILGMKTLNYKYTKQASRKKQKHDYLDSWFKVI